MPKVVSRSTVSSSTEAQPTASSSTALRIYYCICGEFINARLKLAIDKKLATLPRRKTDGAIIIRSQDNDAAKAAVFKLNAVSGDPVLLERPGGHERQYRFHCPRCKLLIAYQSTPLPIKSGPFIYISDGALTERQGQLPPNAFGENDS